MNGKIDITDVAIKTERLLLRPFEESDLDDFFEYASVDGVGQAAGWAPHENKEKTQIILDEFIAGKKTFAIVYENKVIGSVGIETYDEKDFPEFADKSGREIGFVLSKEFWGQGIMTEAVKAVVRYCFFAENLDFLLCGYFVRNNRSKRVQEKCGFSYLKTLTRRTRIGTEEETITNVLYNE